MRTVRIICIAIFASLLAQSAWGQQDPDFTLYNNNMMVLNPAYAGISDGLSVSAIYRKQWLGISGSPQGAGFSGHAYIPGFKVGAGLTGWQYSSGAFKQTLVNTDYSYRLNLGFAWLNLGLQAGVMHYQTYYSDADLNGIFDPLFSSDVNQTRFNWGTGAFLYNDDFYAGISVPTMATYGNKDNVVVKLDRQYYVTGGYLFHVNEDLVLKPNGMLRITEHNPTLFYAGLTAYYGEHFGLGVIYKSQKAVAFHVDLIFDKSIYVGYAYDLVSATDIKTVSSGSHEFVLTYILPWGGKENQGYWSKPVN